MFHQSGAVEIFLDFRFNHLKVPPSQILELKLFMENLERKDPDFIFEHLKVTTSPNKKNSPIKGWGGLSKMSNKMSKMSIIELSWLGQDLFDFSGLTWAHPLTHPSTHR